jgi:GNAT superfamily N-acetyltransferase
VTTRTTPLPSPTAREAHVRPVAAADLPACASVFYAGLDGYMAGANQPLLPRNEAGMVVFFSHLLATDPGRAWLSEDADGVVDGFGLAHQRDDFWFLSFLFVRPMSQARGVGRQLLLRCFPHDPAQAEGDGMGGATAWAGVLGTCIDSLQPISTGLYAGYGLVPRVPLFTMFGRPRPGSLPALPATLERVTFGHLAADADGHRRLTDAIAALDTELLGYTRAVDHRAWRLADRQGTLYRDRASGETVGYGYAQPSGRLGPVALRHGELLPAVLGDLTASVQPAGDWQVYMPGVAERGIVALLGAGFRFEGTPAIFCSSRAGPDLERYVPASFALL